METQRDAVLQVLKLRGLPVSATFPRRLVEFKAVPPRLWCSPRWNAATRPTPAVGGIAGSGVRIVAAAPRATATSRRSNGSGCLSDRFGDVGLYDQFPPQFVERCTDPAGGGAVARVEHATHHLYVNAEAARECAA